MHSIASPDRRGSLVRLTGLIILLFVLNSAIGLFSLRLASQRHAADLATLNLLMETLDNTRQAQVHFKNQVQEWKNVLLRGTDPEDLKRYAAAMRREAFRMRERLDSALDGMTKLDLTEAGLVGPLQAEHHIILEAYEERIAHFGEHLARQAADVDRELRGIDRELNVNLDGLVSELLIRAAALRLELSREFMARDATTTRVMVIGAGATTILLLVMLGLAVRRG
ncbi:hypothetical protein [Desulfonatronum thiodismutans]|uniref:hypothetical protein n=1 Tax=Desulfonatronum thiodismutans TaxID=159290 RepID=UPI0004ABDEBD|nr:hypothetical protein [Desulfonatronum thiodismutans]